jgi:hypothetical protein
VAPSAAVGAVAARSHDLAAYIVVAAHGYLRAGKTPKTMIIFTATAVKKNII